MIDYSVYLMTSGFDKTAAPKAYAKAQCSEVLSFDAFVEHISDHNGVYTKGTVKGVISDMCECLVEMLLEGKKILLGDLGDFWISLSSEGADSIANFKASNITEVNILFTPGEDFENLRSEATFNVVSSRAAQAATLKAEKAGETTVDLAAAKNKTTSSGSADDTEAGDTDTDTGADTDTGSGTGTDTEAGSGSGSGSDSGSGSGSGNTGGDDSGDSGEETGGVGEE